MGKKTGEGKMINSAVDIDRMKQEYMSLAKKATQGKEFLQKYGATVASPDNF